MIRHRHTLTLAAALMIASITAGHAASAQQRTLYGSDGKVVGQSVTGSNGAVTHYGADGRVISRPIGLSRSMSASAASCERPVLLVTWVIALPTRSVSV